MNASNQIISEKLQILHDSYTEKLPEKSKCILNQWQLLITDWSEHELKELHRMCHSLTGSGGIFDYSQVSNQARALILFSGILLLTNKCLTKKNRFE